MSWPLMAGKITVQNTNGKSVSIRIMRESGAIRGLYHQTYHAAMLTLMVGSGRKNLIAKDLKQ